MNKMRNTTERLVTDSVSEKIGSKFFARFHSRPPLERIMRVHEQLQARRFPNCNKIAVLFETSPKTIQRDIDFMRDRLGLPIAYNPKRFGFYYYTAPEHGPPFPWTPRGSLSALAGILGA